jgi:ATP-binding cassette subfamily A (ABC1) protein 3
MCCSTTFEIILPILVMLIMVGIRAAITKDDFGPDLHVWNPTPAEKAAADAALPAVTANNYPPITDGHAYNGDYKATFDATYLAQYLYQGYDRYRLGFQKVKTVQFVPGNDPLVKDMADTFQTRYPILMHPEGFPLTQTRFNSEDDLDAYIKGPDYAASSQDAQILAAVVFHQVGTAANDWNWQYSIRGNQSQNTRSANTLSTSETTVNTLQTRYDDSGLSILMFQGAHFLLQDHVETYIVEKSSGRQFQTRSAEYQPFPVPPYIFDPFSDTVSAVLGLFYTIIYIWPVTRLVKGIVEEKQLRIKEGMKMMGLPDSALFCSWFGTYVLMFLITSIGITIVTSGSVYKYSSKGHVFIFFFFFSLTTFAFCWLVSVFFSRSTVASTMAALVFLGSFFPYFAVTGGSHSAAQKATACLSAPICFGLGAVVIQTLESTQGGVQPHNSNTMVDNWNYNGTIGMFIADFFIYIILALYFQQVVPSEWGTHQKPWFIFLPSYWCPDKVANTPQAARANIGATQAEMGGIELPHRQLPEGQALVGNEQSASHFFEPVTDAVRASLGVAIRGLRKVFNVDGSDPQVAVKNMNLDLYTGQILALLGHNGKFGGDCGVSF